MASSICNRLIRKVWRSFIDDLGDIPEAEGIYTIGLLKTDENVVYLYVGYSKDMHGRARYPSINGKIWISMSL